MASPTPYWLTREFCAEHGRKGGTQLTREFPDCKLSTWYDRRMGMHAAFPGLVPLLDRLGNPVASAGVEYKQTTEILGDGTQRSDKLVAMSEEQSKDAVYLLTAHGFDPREWEVISARNSMWQQGGENPTEMYASRISVRPLTGRIDIDAIVEAVRTSAPIMVQRPSTGKGLLEVNNTDMHLGNSTLKWYKSALEREVELIEGSTWDEIIVPIGSDLFHADNFKNTTSNGTAISSVDWPSAWSDATRYYATIIEAALSHSAAVYVYYVIGNHDESMAWAFTQMMAARYPQCRYDLSIDERKVHVFGDVAIGMTHGDNKTRKDLDRIFMSEFPDFASAIVREVHAGHYHHEVTRDEYGVVVRSLSTAARTDKWHREEGFVGAMKRFACFEFSPDALVAIHYA